MLNCYKRLLFVYNFCHLLDEDDQSGDYPKKRRLGMYVSMYCYVDSIWLVCGEYIVGRC